MTIRLIVREIKILHKSTFLLALATLWWLVLKTTLRKAQLSTPFSQ